MLNKIFHFPVSIVSCLVKNCFLAHLWGAYAILLMLSVVHRLLSVSTINTRNKDIKSIFGENVYHLPGLCLLGIGGAPYISHGTRS